ncbi:MAG TPA: phosphatase PAP2 family protein [Brumimicrobium sp.]|nr:phosphatase PAP2 family protein [Brumimicrobium sp.]
MRAFASFISWLFLPLFTPIYALLAVMYIPMYSTSFVANASLYLLYPTIKMLYLLLFLIFITIAPGISFYVMKKNKTISSIQMENREERRAPILLMFFYCLMLFFFLNYQAEGTYVPSILKAMVFGGALAAIIAFLVTERMKISLHAIGMGAMFGFLYMYSLPLENIPLILLISVLTLGGIVMAARIYLNAHTLKEITWGYLLGFFTQVICIFLI